MLLRLNMCHDVLAGYTCKHALILSLLLARHATRLRLSHTAGGLPFPLSLFLRRVLPKPWYQEQACHVHDPQQSVHAPGGPHEVETSLRDEPRVFLRQSSGQSLRDTPPGDEHVRGATQLHQPQRSVQENIGHAEPEPASHRASAPPGVGRPTGSLSRGRFHPPTASMTRSTSCAASDKGVVV